MSFTGKSLHCIDCGNNFTFTVEEQEFRCSQGYPNEPVRCSSCRQVRTNERTQTRSEDNSSHRPSLPVICTQCGKATRVPFQPRQNEPVYCSSCYIKTRVGR